jgi:hypothetical protein
MTKSILLSIRIFIPLQTRTGSWTFLLSRAECSMRVAIADWGI